MSARADSNMSIEGATAQQSIYDMSTSGDVLAPLQRSPMSQSRQRGAPDVSTSVGLTLYKPFAVTSDSDGQPSNILRRNISNDSVKSDGMNR